MGAPAGRIGTFNAVCAAPGEGDRSSENRITLRNRRVEVFITGKQSGLVSVYALAGCRSIVDNLQIINLEHQRIDQRLRISETLLRVIREVVR